MQATLTPPRRKPAKAQKLEILDLGFSIATESQKADSYARLMEACRAYVAENKEQILSPRRVVDVFLPIVAQLDVESFFVLCLNVRQEPISEPMLITAGLLNSTQYHPREIFRRAISQNAAGIILAHNHPSGNPQPSAEDVQATQKLIEAGKIIGILVQDHVVIGKTGQFHSMRQAKACRFE